MNPSPGPTRFFRATICFAFRFVKHIIVATDQETLHQAIYVDGQLRDSDSISISPITACVFGIPLQVTTRIAIVLAMRQNDGS